MQAEPQGEQVEGIQNVNNIDEWNDAEAWLADSNHPAPIPDEVED